MLRRTFLSGSSGLLLSVAFGPSIVHAGASVDARLGTSTVTFRDRFKQTANAAIEGEELTLLKVPTFYRDRFGVRRLELWSKHFEALDPEYLKELRARVEEAGVRGHQCSSGCRL